MNAPSTSPEIDSPPPGDCDWTKALLDGSDPLLTSEQMRAADAFTIEHLCVPGLVLMEHAGRAVAEIAAHEAGDVVHPRVPRSAVVIAGPGNNGGDGFVAARHLLCRDFSVEVFALVAMETLNGDAKLAADAWAALARHVPHRATTWEASADAAARREFTERLVERTACAAVVIDAIFGTGLTRPVEGFFADVIDATNGPQSAPNPVVSVDIPSGFPTDGARAAGAAIAARRTVTFFQKKIVHVCEPGFFACGPVDVVDISIRSASAAPIKIRAWRDVLQPVAPRDDDTLGHKGRYGHVGVVAGAAETAGAAKLAARAALRAGAGLCSLLENDATRAQSLALVEVMRRNIADAPNIESVLEGISAIVVGPGLGTSDEAIAIGRKILRARGARPTVVDADLLAAVFSNEGRGAVDAGGVTHAPLVFTPHPGEAARILFLTTKEEWTSADVQRDRLAATTKLVEAGTKDDVWVLKGAAPIVAQGDRRMLIPGGQPALAVGGSGDVLAGAIAAMLATGCSPFAAAIEGCRRHQAAGAILGHRGALASEIADALRMVQ